jgi:ribosomal protein S18 acetylase RimI-like enzyme
MTAHTMTTRRADVDDLEAIVPLFDGYRCFYRQTSNPDAARDFLAARLAGRESVILVAEEEGTNALLGFVQLYPSFSSVSMARLYILNDLFVAEHARRRGVGAGLLAAAAQFGRSENALGLVLSTAVDNDAAQALYRASGWERDEEYCVFNLSLC